MLRKKGDGNRVTGKAEKRMAEEKISQCSEEEYEKSWWERDRRWKQGAVEEHHTLWQPLIKEKSRKKKNKDTNNQILSYFKQKLQLFFLFLPKMLRLTHEWLIFVN